MPLHEFIITVAGVNGREFHVRAPSMDEAMIAVEQYLEEEREEAEC